MRFDARKLRRLLWDEDYGDLHLLGSEAEVEGEGISCDEAEIPLRPATGLRKRLSTRLRSLERQGLTIAPTPLGKNIACLGDKPALDAVEREILALVVLVAGYPPLQRASASLNLNCSSHLAIKATALITGYGTEAVSRALSPQATLAQQRQVARRDACGQSGHSCLACVIACCEEQRTEKGAGMKDWTDRITADPNICHGKPCVKGRGSW